MCTGIYAQTFEKQTNPTSDIARFGDILAGDNMNFALVKFIDNSGITHEWIHFSSSRGSTMFNNFQQFSAVVELTNGSFSGISTPQIIALSNGGATFANIDGNNWPDLVQTGYTGNVTYTKVYLSDENALFNYSQDLYGTFRGAVACIPANDGDGIVLTGKNLQDGSYRTKIYSNNNAVMMELFDGDGGINGSAHAVDVGNGLEPRIHGINAQSIFINKKHILQTDGTYQQLDTDLPAISNGSSLYIDIDNDGDLDCIIAGIIVSDPGAPRLILVFENDGFGNYTRKQEFPGGDSMKLIKIDMNTDGYPGFVAMGTNYGGVAHHIGAFVNTAGTINEWENHPFDSETNLPDWYGNGFASGGGFSTDMNGDGKPDLVVGGRTADTGASNGQYKMLVYLNTTEALGLTDNELKAKSKIYPNPVSDILHIELPEGKKLKSFSLFDVTGRKMVIKQNTTNTLNISQYATGIYSLKFETQDGLFGEKKIVKN